MPCRCDHMEPNDREIEAKLVSQHLVYVYTKLGHTVPPELRKNADNSYATNADQWTAKLCGVLGNLTQPDLEAVVYDAHSEQARNLANWWEAHQEADRKREAKERKDAADAQLRAATLASLTPEQRRVLGVH